MLRFLSKFNLATRIYASFLFLGGYAVLVCFGAMFAVGYIHKEYAKADNVIENTRQMSSLETYLFSLNRALFEFDSKDAENDRLAVADAFKAFEEKAEEVRLSLEIPEVQERYSAVMGPLLDKYRTNMEEIFSLHEKSAEASEKADRFAEKSSEELNGLIDETTLPSASFALNGLREQLDAVLKSVAAVSADDEESQKQLADDFAALKKAQTAARQAEMVNMKKLTSVFSALNSLDEEINRKLKIDAALREKMKAVNMTDGESAKDLKGLVDFMAQSSARVLSDAEAGKISLQKLFVIAAGLAGFFAVMLSFMSLFGIRYPLSRLVENAQEMARGNRSVLIHFTERGDEVGALARALAVLLVRLKEVPVLTDELLGRTAAPTFGASMAYVPLGSPAGPSVERSAENESSSEEFAYFGQGVGVDPESQLCQMLSLVQQISASASEMNGEIRQRFDSCRSRLGDLAGVLNDIGANLTQIQQKASAEDFDSVQENMTKLSDYFSAFISVSEDIGRSLDGDATSAAYTVQLMEQVESFVSGLWEWVRVAAELTDLIKKTSAETKILTLNASIEAAKAGDKAKAFGSVMLDMRRQTQKTTETADQLLSHLGNGRKEMTRLADVVEKTGTEIRSMHHTVSALVPLYGEQLQFTRSAAEVAETAAVVFEERKARHEEICADVENLPAKLLEAEQLPAHVEEQMNDVLKSLDVFVASLPTYEEDSGTADS